ncbi:MAG: ABC transporter ATP-binding protein [Bacteroidota bacterium]
MSNFMRIMEYAWPYKRVIGASVFFNILTVLFSLGSITILIPVLKIIFENTDSVSTPPTYTGILEIKSYLEALLNYRIGQQVAEVGVQPVLFYVLVVACSFFLGKNIFRYLGSISLAFIKNGVERDLRNAIHQKTLSLPVSYFTEKRKGDILARLTTDITEIQWALLSSIHRLIQDPLMIISTLILLVILSPKLTLFVAILIPITGFLITTIGNTLKKPSERAKAYLGQLTAQIDENLGGLTIIQSYVAEGRIQALFRSTNEAYFQSMNSMLYRRNLSSPISETLGSFVILGIVWFGGALILESNELQPEVFITYIALIYQILSPAKSLSTAIYDIKRGDASAERILAVMDAPNPLIDEFEITENLQQFNESIQIEDISFAYDEDPILKNFSLHIPKGKTIALVGQSGSGKTTVANLLNRFYDVQDGAIKIDGKDIRNIPLDDLRQQIGYISQDAILFNTSIRQNLLLGKPDATEEEILAATKVANAHDFILETENGYDTIIGDRGSKLSGGQRQRLTIARAVLKNPSILILDEATSALDSESEKLVQEALEKLTANRTSIVIAHRLSTIQHADEIIVMRKGKIIERGNHQHLLQKEGAYQKLVALQAF